MFQGKVDETALQRYTPSYSGDPELKVPSTRREAMVTEAIFSSLGTAR
jgi:hypothetical protein